MRDLKEDIRTLRAAIDRDPEDFGSRWDLAQLLAKRGSLDEAIPLFVEAARIAPPEEDLAHAAADELDKGGHHAAAVLVAEEGLRRRPQDTGLAIRLGRALRKRGRVAEALEILERAYSIDSKDPEIPVELAKALAQAGRGAEAHEHLVRTQGISDWYVEFGRVVVHAASGRIPEALRALEPLLCEEHRLDAIIGWVEGDPILEDVRCCEPGRSLLATAREARDYWRRREDPYLSTEEMLEVALAYSRRYPAKALPHYDAGRSLRALGRLPDAEQALRTAISLTEDPSIFREELGKALAAQGKLEAALALAEDLRRNSRSPEFGLNLKVAVYAISGKLDLAVQALEELLSADPTWHAAVDAEALALLKGLPATQRLLDEARRKIQPGSLGGNT